MNRPSTDNRNLPVRLALVLFVAVAMSFYLMGGLVAKYGTSDTAAEGARMAGFSLNLSDSGSSHVVDLTEVRKPGDSETYAFSVLSASEVSQRYWVITELNGSMPVQLEVKGGTLGNQGESVLSTTVEKLDERVTESKPLIAKSNAFEVGPNTRVAGEFTITATWPKDCNNIDYANDSVGELVVRVAAEQVD